MCEQSQHYRDLAMQCTQALTGMPGSGDKTGKQERYMVLLMDTHQEMLYRLRELIAERKQADEAIKKLPDALHRAVLRMYYLAGMTMEDIADKAYLGRNTVYRARREALELIEKSPGP